MEWRGWRPNRASYRKFDFNEFVANVLRDNMGSKKIQPPTSKKIFEAVFIFLNWDFGFEISQLGLKVFMPTSKK